MPLFHMGSPVKPGTALASLEYPEPPQHTAPKPKAPRKVKNLKPDAPV